MNDRINQLFSQALDSAVPETWTRLDWDQLSKFKNEFAELLVKSVADQMALDLIGWLKHQEYSGRSHRTVDMGYDTEPGWFNADEIYQYLPGTIDRIKQNILKE